MIAGVILMGAGCTQTCVKSHVETVTVPEEITYTYVQNYWTGLPKRVQTGVKPSYQKNITVCDEYSE